MLFICPRRVFSPLVPALLPMLLLFFMLALPQAAHAHRVNIFAWTEGGQIIAECGFNGGNKVKQGQVVVYDAATGAKIQEGRTDDQGVYRFPVPAEGKAHGLRIVIKAGEGHQNEWMMDAAELSAVQTPPLPPAPPKQRARCPQLWMKHLQIRTQHPRQPPEHQARLHPPQALSASAPGSCKPSSTRRLMQNLAPSAGNLPRCACPARDFLKSSAALAGWWDWRALPFTSRDVRGNGWECLTSPLFAHRSYSALIPASAWPSLGGLRYAYRCCTA